LKHKVKLYKHDNWIIYTIKWIYYFFLLYL
jgi:hypothetical protein